MNTSQQILSEVVTFQKYARYIPENQRRETWLELCNRNMLMHIKKFPELKDEIIFNYEYVKSKKVFPSMRSMQFAGLPIELSNVRLYNCSYHAASSIDFFSETMFLLLSGVGVGFSVQRHHVEQLPPIKTPVKYQRFLVGDSIAGWADAVKILMRAFLDPAKKTRPLFDFRDIRHKGMPLITAGGKAPGPEPLKVCLAKIESILESKQAGTKLTTLEVHDIACFIADAVLAGGIRRAAMISLFSPDDHEMLSSKTGDWWELHPERARANNSAVFHRKYVTKEQFDKYWDYLVNSNTGEPGFMFTNNTYIGLNPCAEISLKNNGLCNLTTINGELVQSQEDFNTYAKVASFLGTLQASYTDFYYLNNKWEQTAKDDALLGISITGQASGIAKYDMTEAVNVAIEENIRIANLIGINTAKRVSCTKPEGTTSCVAGTSSGIHAWHNDYYLRRIRINKVEALYTYLLINHADLLEDEYFSPETTAVIAIPQKASYGAITRHNETPIQLLERIKDVMIRWVLPGHIIGDNTHNVSATVSVKDDEWIIVRDWIWENREFLTAVSCFPHSDANYKQMPFEDITKEQYEELSKNLHEMDLSNVIEIDPNINHSRDSVACAGGNCNIV